MKNKSFCTISTLDYMPYVLALYDSLKRCDVESILHVFITDAPSECMDSLGGSPSVRLYCVDDLCKNDVGKKLFVKYHAVSMDNFRWSMKPVFLKYLLENTDCEKIMYVDTDIYFFNDYAFLFDELDSSDIILTPHWRASDPHADHSNFFKLYTSGLYNGGFIGVTKNAVRALEWWAMACLYVCEKNETRGQFVDQTHLNLLPIYFDNVKIIKHRGCNVANWNLVECTRIQKGDTVLINGKDPIVFIHFTRSTVRGILKGNDGLLVPFLNKYRENLRRYGANLPDVAAVRPYGRPAGASPGIIQRIRAFLNG